MRKIDTSYASYSEPYPLAEPTYAAGCYTLHLYCDHAYSLHGFQEFPHMYTGHNQSQCTKAAKADGWRMHPDRNLATCPKCTAALGMRRVKRRA